MGLVINVGFVLALIGLSVSMALWQLESRRMRKQIADVTHALNGIRQELRRMMLSDREMREHAELEQYDNVFDEQQGG